MVFELLVNDLTLWYLTLKGLPVPDIGGKFKDTISNMDANRDITGSREIMEKLIKLHIYSSTVTEGNTASNEDVERIINDLPTNLTPKEIIEIKNTKDALDHIIEVHKDTDLNLDLIKSTHQILMRGLIKEAGVFFASSTKRIVGSKLKLPSTNSEIEYLMSSLMSFYHINKNHIHPLILVSITLGCIGSKPQSDASASGETGKNRVAVIETDKGTIKFELYEKEAPITTKNFIDLAQKDFYNGLTFHRVEPGFVIQGGDPKGDGTGGSGKTIPLEIAPTLTHKKGAVAMARSNAPNSASSQFYICLEDAKFLDGKYAIFGQVIEGQDVVEKIAIGDKMLKVTIGEK